MESDLDYAVYFIHKYWELMASMTREDAYDECERLYGIRYEKQIKMKKMKPTRFANYESFRRCLSRYIDVHKSKLG